MRYFARVTAGLEHIAWSDIERQTGATLDRFGHRRIDFTYAGEPANLLTLRSVDDVYVYVTDINELNHTRPSLSAFHQLRGVDFSPALEVIRQVRVLAEPPTYGVTASFLGKRNYSRYDIEDRIHTVLYERLPWRFVANRPDENDTHDIDLRVLMEDDWALVGIRLGDSPLHRRPYKLVSLAGSLKAPVAYCLCLLADLQPTDTLIDPTCGAGTILVEAAPLLSNGKMLGIDLNPAAIEAAHQNAMSAGLSVDIIPSASRLTDRPDIPEQIRLYNGDATTIHWPTGSFNAVITNLPWGKQVLANADLASVYLGILNTTTRGLAQGGRLVLLTDQKEALNAALSAHPEIQQVSTIQISLFGSHPTIYQLTKTSQMTEMH